MKKLSVKIISIIIFLAIALALFACQPASSGKTSVATATLTLSVYSASLNVGTSLQLTAISSDGAEVTFYSSDEAVATVDQNGLITAKNKGAAQIIAVAGGASGICYVTVIGQADEQGATLPISANAVTVRQGESVKITATSPDGSDITWLSSDDTIATVSGGVISGVDLGTATVYAWDKNLSAECVVTVVDMSYTDKDGYTMVWNDEFDGTALDMTKWSYMLGVQDVYGDSRGPMFWGNNEQQYYTENAVTVSDGTLKITAKRENMPEGRNYSSARICTRNKGFWTYGYFEARIKLPAVEGMWPAFWMLPEPTSASGTANEYGYWAACGEIDVMEAKGRLPNRIDTTLHFGNYGSSTFQTSITSLKKPITEWHTYALEWKPKNINWYIDGALVLSLDSKIWWSAAAPTSDTAPFDVDFYILLNLAVGGNFDGGREPDASFISADMEVDYVRVYSAVAG